MLQVRQARDDVNAMWRHVSEGQVQTFEISPGTRAEESNQVGILCVNDTVIGW